MILAPASLRHHRERGERAPSFFFLGNRGKGVPSFDEMVAIVLVEVDLDDPTTNVRGRLLLLELALVFLEEERVMQQSVA